MTTHKIKIKTKTKSQKRKGGDKNNPTANNYMFTMNDNHVRRAHSHDKSPLYADDDTYNNNLFLRESHNCYTYFLNLKSKEAMELCKKDFKNYNMCRRAQPGYLSGFKQLSKKDYNCPEIEKRTLADNPLIYKVKIAKKKCDPRFYKGAMVVAPGRDYHYYRLNNEGVWTHKPGYKPSTRYDSDRNLILDPQWAARDYGGTLNYKNFCGYYCVPRNDKRKNMTHKHGVMQPRNLEYNKHEKLFKRLKIKKNNNTQNIIGQRVTNLLLGNKKRWQQQQLSRKKSSRKTQKKKRENDVKMT